MMINFSKIPLARCLSHINTSKRYALLGIFVIAILIVIGLIECKQSSAEKGKDLIPVAKIPKITLGEPIIVSQAPVELKNWGPWQFPHIERLKDNRLHISYHLAEDSVKAYGLKSGHALSSDNGKTWELVEKIDGYGGLLLPNGDRLMPKWLPSRKIEDVKLPEPILKCKGSYGEAQVYYRAADLAPGLENWRFSRKTQGKTTWVEEIAKVHIPGETRCAAEGMFTFTSFYQDSLRVAPDGSIWGVIHSCRIVDRKVQEKSNVLFLRSSDNGHEWNILNEILYQPDKTADPKWDKRSGFSEPEFNFMPDGSVICLMRTTDGAGVGPLYFTRSGDGGKTWAQPRVFDDKGVWPQLLTLKSGVTLAAYGRPGLYIRATSDSSGQIWGPGIEVVKPGKIYTDTCSYSGLIELNDNTALIVYSVFNYPDEQGQKRKTILVRPILVSQN